MCIVLAIAATAAASVGLLAWGAATTGSRAPAPRRPPGAHGLATIPAAAQAAVAERLGAADTRFWARRTAGGATFSDTRTGIDAQVSRSGVVVRIGALSWSLGLRAVGRSEHTVPVGPAWPVVHANQVTLRHAAAVEERYAFGPLGLEQGFTIGKRPPGTANYAVVLALGDTPRGLTAVIADGGRTMLFERGGHVMLRYWGLSASDAQGRSLPASIETVGRTVRLWVDDRGARYPVRVDPFVQAGKLTASDGAIGDQLGHAVAISGDTLVVGASGENSNQGAAYVFVKPAAGWANATQTAKLTASDGQGNDEFGSSVAISGDTIVVGAQNAHAGNGAVYVFVKPVGGWRDVTQTAELTASDGAQGDQLGSSVATLGDTVAAGGVGGASHPGTLSGAVYMFVEPAAGWVDASQTAKLTASDGRDGDLLGTAVAISGDTVAAGAPVALANGFQGEGAVYVFVKPAGGWADGTQSAKLTKSDDISGTDFGDSVALSVDTLAAGAPFAAGSAGAVYVFSEPAGGWADGAQTAKLTASDEAQGDDLGASVAIFGNTVVAGAPQTVVVGGPPPKSGAVYTFVKPAHGWVDGTETTKLTASDGTAGDKFGNSVTASSDAIGVGAPRAMVAGTSQGAAYVFAGSVGALRPTTTFVNCSPGSVPTGQATTCTATVLDAGPDPKSTPTGTVTFSSDSHGTFGNPGASCTLGQVGVGKASCHVDYTPSAVDSGTHTITASYNGDGTHAASSGTGTVTVTGGGGGGGAGQRPTATSVSCSPAPVAVGSETSCGARVIDTGNGQSLTPTGTVTFSSDSHGTFTSSSCTLTHLDSATAFCVVGYTPSAIDSGTHTITALYTGDGAHSRSSGATRLAISVPPPLNTALPSIYSPVRSCQYFNGRPVCQVLPYEYGCDPGQWVGNDPATPYQYEWQQLYDIRQGNALIPVWQREPNGNSVSFNAFNHPALNLPTGFFRCLVTATGRGGSTVAASPQQHLQVGPSLPRGIPLPTPVDIHVTGIEVTQGTQEALCPGCRFVDPNHTICATCVAPGTLPSRDQANGDTPGDADYSGVTMAAGKQTVVRVYANVTGGPGPSGSLTGATAQLQVYDAADKLLCLGGAVSPSCAINPLPRPVTLQAPAPDCPLCVDLATRANPNSSYYFLIPASDTFHRSLTFKATVTPRVFPNLPGLCGGCGGNVFTLHSVPFKQPATVTIWPIPLTIYGLPVPPDRQQWLQPTFGDAQTVMPNPLQILPWDGTLAVEGLDKSHAVEAVDDRAEDNNLASNIMPIGVYVPGAYPGLSINTSQETGTLFDDDHPPRAIVPYCTAIAPPPLVAGQANCRPLTAVAHEITHALAIGHADVPTRAPGDNTPDCGGDSGGSNSDFHYGEAWPPDYEGRIQGVGFDVRYWTPFAAGSLPGTFVDGYNYQGKPAKGRQYYDYMSYCGLTVNPGKSPPEPRDWISPHNWQRLVDFNPPPQNLPAAADRSGRALEGVPLRVIAGIESDGRASIFDVTPGRRSTHLPTPGSPYRLELRGASGNVLASVVPSTTLIHADGERPSVLLSGTLPMAAGAASVAITAGGQVLAHRVRSAHAPTVRFLSPRPGSRVGRTGTTVVRFSARDADGDRLSAKVYYSPDGGSSWRVVAGPITSTLVRVPSRLLGGSRDGRLQVRVSDGFNLTTVTSGRLRVVGTPPVVQIIGAPRRGQVRADEMLPLQGSAFDDRSRPITGGHLRWYLGKRLIGIGENATLHGMRPGSTVLRLVATDSHGRSRQATIRLRVSAVAARYLLFDAPLLVSSRARTVRIRVASSAPATFTIAGRRYAVSQRLRTITVAVRRGTSLIRLPCALRSPGGVVRGTYIALRGR